MNKGFRRSAAVITTIVVSAIATQQALAEESKKPNYVQGQLGILLPTSDLDDGGFDPGGGVSLGYGRYITDNLIVEVSLDSFASERDFRGFNVHAGNYDVEDTVLISSLQFTLKGETSIEALDIFYGGGVGAYAVTLDSEIESSRLGSFDKDDSDAVLGLHLVAGANYNISTSFYAGIEAKYRWTDDVDLSQTVVSIPLEYSGDLSGYTVMGTFGFRF